MENIDEFVERIIEEGKFEQLGENHTNKIFLIKRVREITGLGLRDCTDVVDHLVTKGLYGVKEGNYCRGTSYNS